MNKILISNPIGIGDVLFTTPVIANLRFGHIVAAGRSGIRAQIRAEIFLVFSVNCRTINIMNHIKKRSTTDLIELYAGEWVAMTSDQTSILAHSRNLKTALRQAHQKGEEFPHMVKSSNESTASVIY